MAETPTTELHDPTEVLDLDELPTSSLLQLPNDVRHIIFKYALIADHAISWPAESSSHKIGAALLRTCRQAYNEAGPILYRYNRFTFSHPSDCNIFRRIMDRNHASQMSNLAFNIRERDFRLWTAYHASDDPIRSLTADIPNLHTLLVVFRQYGWNFIANPDEAFKLWDKNHRLRNVCMSLERSIASITVICTMEIPENHFEHLKTTQAPYLAVHDGYARTNKAVEIHSAMAVLELLSPRASFAERSRIIGI